MTDDLRARHVAWSKARLRSPAGKVALRKNLEAGLEAILKSRVSTVLHTDSAVRVLESFSSDAFLTRAVRPLARAAVMLEIARLREEPAHLKIYVSDEAQALMEKLVERPGLLPKKFVQKLLSHEAFEAIARDVLDEALHEFGDKVNPFTAEWGLPSLLRTAGPLSLGIRAFAKSLETIRDEFDKRLEPERKRFLQGFARRALSMVAEFVVRRNDEPQFVALRKELLHWLLEQPVGELMEPVRDDNVELTHDITHAITRHVAAMEATHRRRRAGIEMILAAHGRQTVEEALATYGADVRPGLLGSVDGKPSALDALTDALWPIVQVGLDAPEVDAFVEDLVGGFYDEK